MNITFLDTGHGISIPHDHELKDRKHLEIGTYKLITLDSMFGTNQLAFQKFNPQHDKLVDLPTPEYQQIITEIDMFLKPETQARFKELGFLYKRSALLYGIPGTGKTCLINRVIQKVNEKNGFVIFDPDPKLLSQALKILDETHPDNLILVVFEEFDKWVKRYESEFLNLLDGEVQKENIIYLATTNFIQRIPPRIIRPGRFASIIEMGMPNAKTRKCYLQAKFGENVDVAEYVEKTAGLTIDEVKEVVLAAECLGYTCNQVVKKIKKIKKTTQNSNPTTCAKCGEEEEYCDCKEAYTISLSEAIQSGK